jgi:plasmid stabilization system protein ParE
MRYRYTFADAARRDLDQIAAFYAGDGDDPDAVTRFVSEVYRVITLLLEHPLAGECIDEAHRHFRLKDFPFYLNYRVDEEANSIRVIAVSDQRRRPGYWRNRVKEPDTVYEVLLAA